MMNADFVLNRAKGRLAEWAERVNANDPTNSIFVIGLLAATGIETDAVLKDKDDLAALVSGTTNEATNTGYARKLIDNTGGLTVTYDDTNDWVDVDVPDQTWTALANDGTGAVSDLFSAYDSDSTGGADSAILVGTIHDFAVTPDGSDVVAQIATGGFYRAA